MLRTSPRLALWLNQWELKLFLTRVNRNDRLSGQHLGEYDRPRHGPVLLNQPPG